MNGLFADAFYELFFVVDDGPPVRGVGGNACALNDVGAVVSDVGVRGAEVFQILTEPAPERPRPREEALVR